MGAYVPQPIEVPALPGPASSGSSWLVSSHHARLDSTLPGVPRRPLSPSGRTRGREPRPAASTRHPPAVEASPSSPYFVGPSPLGLRPSALPRVAAESGCRGPTAHPADGLGQPDLGCAPNPRRAPEGRLRCKRTNGFPVPRTDPTRTSKDRISDLEHLPAQPGQGHRHRRPVHRAHGQVPGPLRLRCPRTRTPAPCLRERDDEPDGFLARPADSERFSLEHCAQIHDQGPRQGIWKRVLPPSPGSRHPGHQDRYWRPEDELLRRTPHRYDPPRTLRPRHRVE